MKRKMRSVMWCDREQPHPKSGAGRGHGWDSFAAESGLVTVTGLLWDCDVSPGTQRGEEANKGEKETRGRWGRRWEPQGD